MDHMTSETTSAFFLLIEMKCKWIISPTIVYKRSKTHSTCYVTHGHRKVQAIRKH